MSRCRALLSPSATVLEATQVYSPAEARLTSCVVDIVDIIVDIVDIISIHLQHQGAVAQDDATLHILRHPLALQSAFIVCMGMTVGSREPSRRFRRVLREGLFGALVSTAVPHHQRPASPPSSVTCHRTRGHPLVYTSNHGKMSYFKLHFLKYCIKCRLL